MVRPIVPFAEAVHDRVAMKIMPRVPAALPVLRGGAHEGEAAAAVAGEGAGGCPGGDEGNGVRGDHAALLEFVGPFRSYLRFSICWTRSSGTGTFRCRCRACGRAVGRFAGPADAGAKERVDAGAGGGDGAAAAGHGQGPRQAAPDRRSGPGGVSPGLDVDKIIFYGGAAGETPEGSGRDLRAGGEAGKLQRRVATKGPGQINVAVSTLVPRPHTPLHGRPCQPRRRSGRRGGGCGNGSGRWGTCT